MAQSSWVGTTCRPGSTSSAATDPSCTRRASRSRLCLRRRSASTGTAPIHQGLFTWDPERYSRLSIPTDDASYDIFTQAARHFGPSRPLAPIDPLGGLRVDRLRCAVAGGARGRATATPT